MKKDVMKDTGNSTLPEDDSMNFIYIGFVIYLFLIVTYVGWKMIV